MLGFIFCLWGAALLIAATGFAWELSGWMEKRLFPAFGGLIHACLDAAPDWVIDGFRLPFLAVVDLVNYCAESAVSALEMMADSIRRLCAR